MPDRVIFYKLHWNAKEEKGKIDLHGADRESLLASLEDLDDDSFLVISDILRHESPIHYDAETGTLSTDAEMVGEAEHDNKPRVNRSNRLI
ncbi:MAG: hypothetical protein ACOCX1_01780 [Fimbriimonadaceae bacterium]